MKYQRLWVDDDEASPRAVFVFRVCIVVFAIIMFEAMEFSERISESSTSPYL